LEHRVPPLVRREQVEAIFELEGRDLISDLSFIGSNQDGEQRGLLGGHEVDVRVTQAGLAGLGGDPGGMGLVPIHVKSRGWKGLPRIVWHL
jgi:hypothetical protein